MKRVRHLKTGLLSANIKSFMRLAGFYFLALLLGFALAIPVDAQRQQQAPQNNRPTQQATNQRNAPQRNRVQYIKYYMKQDGDSLLINMDIDMSNLKFRKNRKYARRPALRHRGG